jgi:hypothetical protein
MRIIAFRENGTFLTEEVMGFEGFARNESILCHAQAPCRVNDLGSFTAIAYEEWVPAAHAHRLLDARRVPSGRTGCRSRISTTRRKRRGAPEGGA